MPKEKRIDCPALRMRGDSYPFGNRVPRTVRMLNTVTADPMPVSGSPYIKGDIPVALIDEIFNVWTNSHGAVAAVLPNGTRLGLHPEEFEVETWHDLSTKVTAGLVDFGFDDRTTKVTQEAYSIFLAREAASCEKIEDLQQRLNAADQMVDELERDKARLDALESNFWIVRYTTSPNGDAGDYSNGIEIVGYWMDAPVERVIGENYSENLRAAIDQAMAAPAYPPTRPEYPEPELGDDDWHMNPCKQGHRDIGASGGVAACNQCNEKIEAATTQEAFEQWNASHPSAHEKPVQPFTEQFIEGHLGRCQI